MATIVDAHCEEGIFNINRGGGVSMTIYDLEELYDRLYEMPQDWFAEIPELQALVEKVELMLEERTEQ